MMDGPTPGEGLKTDGGGGLGGGEGGGLKAASQVPALPLVNKPLFGSAGGY